MSVKKKILRFSCFLFMLAALTVVLLYTANLDVSAEQARSGVSYRVSDDGTYIIIVGTTEQFPSITVESEIDGLPVKEIAKSAFHNNKHLYKIVLPDSIEKIGDQAFRNCSSLVSVKLPNGLKEIPFEAFYDCVSLKNIKLPDSIETISPYAFFNCIRIGKIDIPSNVTFIGQHAFSHCERIIFNANGNEYAKNYALENDVNTSFEGTPVYFWLVMAISTFIAMTAFVILIFLYRILIKKYPRLNIMMYLNALFKKIRQLFCRVKRND